MISDDDIKELLQLAEMSGNKTLADVCRQALSGNEEARRKLAELVAV